MQKKSYLIFCLLLFCVNLFSQNTLSGNITNQDNQALEGSHIHIGNKTVSSDSEGNYSVKKLPNGLTKIHVSFVGYKSIDTTMVIAKNEVVNFVLKKSISNLNEIVVKQERNTVNKTVFEQKIKTETIEKYSTKSLGDALREVVGVSSLKTGSTVVKPVINGLFGSRIPVISNNVRLEDQEWGVEHAPSFDINAAGKITVIKGASGLQYGGDAVGGLVIIEPNSVKKDTLFGKTVLSYDSNGNGGTASTSIHRGNVLGWSYNTLATFKYLGDRNAANYVLSNTGNRESNFTGDVKFSAKRYDISVFYSYYNATIGILSASHTGNANDLYNSINNQIPSVINDFTYTIKSPRQEVQHHLAKANFNYYFNETAFLSVQYAYQFNKRKEFDIRRGVFKNTAALDLDLKTHSFNVDFKKSTHDWTIKTGVNGSLQDNFANPSTGIRPLIPNYDKTTLGSYGVASYGFSDSFTIESGVRYDFFKIEAAKYYFKSRWDERNYSNQFSHFILADYTSQWLTKPTFTFHNISASLGFHKKFEKEFDWFANVSLATRNPNPSEFFSDGLHHSTGVIELGDLALEKEKSVKVATTFQKKWKTFSVELNPYVNFIQDFIFLRPIGFETTIRGAFPVWEYQQDNARLAGIDFQTALKMAANWQHTFSLSYVNGENLSQKEPLIDIQPFTIKNKIQFSKKEWNSLVLELDSEVVMRQNRFPNNNFETNIFQNNESFPVVVDISSPPPTFGLLNFYSEIKFKVFPKIHSVLAFSVQNILNTSYRDYLNRQRFFADELGRNFQVQLKINY
jgi:iron complex outermembrane receptor protein